MLVPCGQLSCTSAVAGRGCVWPAAGTGRGKDTLHLSSASSAKPRAALPSSSWEGISLLNMLFHCPCSYLPCFTPSEHSGEVTHCGTGMLWVFVLHAWSTDPLPSSPSPSLCGMWLLPLYSVRRWWVKGNVLGSPEVLTSVLGRP